MFQHSPLDLCAIILFHSTPILAQFIHFTAFSHESIKFTPPYTILELCEMAEYEGRTRERGEKRGEVEEG